MVKDGDRTVKGDMKDFMALFFLHFLYNMKLKRKHLPRY